MWLAFYQHIWLQKISVLLDPGKIHITCILRSTGNNKPQKMVFHSSLPGKELKPVINRFYANINTNMQKRELMKWKLLLKHAVAWGSSIVSIAL